MDRFYEELAVLLLKNYKFLKACAGRDNVPGLCAYCREVERALGRLSGFERKVVSEAYIEGKSWEEVMGTCFVSHMTIARFRKKIVRIIADALKESCA